MAACEQEGVCDHITPPRVTLAGYFCFVVSSNGPLRDANRRLARMFPACDAEKGGGVVDEAEFARCVRRLGFDEAETTALWTRLARGRPAAIDFDDLLRQYRYPSLAFAAADAPDAARSPAVAVVTNAPSAAPAAGMAMSTFAAGGAGAPSGAGGVVAAEPSVETASAVANLPRLLSTFLLSLAWAAHDDALRERGEHAKQHGHGGASGSALFCVATGWVLDGDDAASVMKLLGDMLRAASKRLAVAELMELFDSDGERARRPSPTRVAHPLPCSVAALAEPIAGPVPSHSAAWPMPPSSRPRLARPPRTSERQLSVPIGPRRAPIRRHAPHRLPGVCPRDGHALRLPWAAGGARTSLRCRRYRPLRGTSLTPAPRRRLHCKPRAWPSGGRLRLDRATCRRRVCVRAVCACARLRALGVWRAADRLRRAS